MNFLPLPTSLLPYWCFPWTTPTWSGYTPFFSHKDLTAFDAIRQIFPWKEFGYSLIRSGHLPLWNPYNFAGQPLLANFQSSYFYPLSWGFLFLPATLAWSVYIYSQPLLLCLFGYLYFRQLFSRLASLFGALSLTFCSFAVTRYFWGVNIHPFLYLPLTLFLIERFVHHHLSPRLFIASQSLLFALSILAGYPQHTLISLGLSFAYFLYRFGPKKLPLLLTSLLLSLLICSVQLLPTWELFHFSLREGPQSREIVRRSTVEAKHLFTLLTPDYFGSPATGNYSGGKDYIGINHYFGIIPLVFALFSLTFLKNRDVKFWAAVAGLSYLFSASTPIASLPNLLRLPILGSGGPWNNLFLFQLAGIFLAVWGFDKFLQGNRTKMRVITLLLTIIIPLLILTSRHFPATVNNLLLSEVQVGALLLILIFWRPIFRYVLPLLVLGAGLFYFQKFSPFGENRFFYPQHPLITYLKSHQGFSRVWGTEAAQILPDLGTKLGLYQIEGYDSLWPRWSGELLASAQNQLLDPAKVDRAVVSLPSAQNAREQKLLNLLGVGYILDRSDDPTHPPSGYPGPKELLWHDDYNYVYRNPSSFPRTFLLSHYKVAQGQAALNELYSQDLRQTVILDQPISPPNQLTSGEAKIVRYDPGQVDISTESLGSSLLLLTDTYYPGWKVRIDNQMGQIIKADYAFRAVLLPAGKHHVVFTYEPSSLLFGLWLSLLGLTLTSSLFIIRSK